MKKIFTAFTLLLAIGVLSTTSVMAHIEEDNTRDWEITNEIYSTIKDWDKVGSPVNEEGMKITNGWFKYGEYFYKTEKGVIVKEEMLFPTNFDAENGSGDLLIKMHIEEDYKDGFEVIIGSQEEGVSLTKRLSSLSEYQGYTSELPAGNYNIWAIHDSNDSKFPTLKELDFPDTFIIQDGKTTVLDIYSKDYYEQEGHTDLVEKMDKAEEDKISKVESEVEKVEEEVIVEKEVKEPNRWLQFVIGAFVILLLAGTGYAAYKHVK